MAAGSDLGGKLLARLPGASRLARKFRETKGEIEALRKEVAELRRMAQTIPAKFDRLLADIDFIKNHTSSYLGDGVSLTYLRDETPMIVNSNDCGGPVNFIAGGEYETENLSVLLSFVRPGTVFLDIGANLGYFAVLVGRRLGSQGRVFTFEPNAALNQLIRRTLLLNGVIEKATVNDFGLSDRDAMVEFHAPAGHLGGNSLIYTAGPGFIDIPAEIRRLDGVLPDGMAVDLVKIDVESHEIEVLRGMAAVIARSPDIKILFECYEPERFAASGGFDLLAGQGFDLYGVGAGARLVKLDDPALSAPGYVLAVRPAAFDGELARARFSLYPGQLKLWPSGQPCTATILAAEGDADAILFHGPYWTLPRGAWRVRAVGDIEGTLRLAITEGFGREAASVLLSAQQPSADFMADHDLRQFECVARAKGGPAGIRLERLDLIRLT